MSFLPVYAIGGITPADLPALRAAGVYGVAVSGVLLTAPDVKRECERILEEVLDKQCNIQ